MPSVQLDLVWTLFVLFCGYSIYTAIVSFTWNDKGLRVFQHLRRPKFVLIYFLVPCVALLLLIMAFDGIRQFTWTFVLPSGFLIGLSFFVMLYILTVPDWPMGRLLQIDRVPVRVIRHLLSINIAAAIVIGIVSATLIVQTPRTIQLGGQSATVTQLEAETQQLNVQRDKSSESISGIRAAAIRKVIEDNTKTAQGVVTLLGGVIGLVTSIRTLSGRGKKNEASR